jgi:predicted ABC-type ATPase
MPELFIIAGCNGAGKTTAAYNLLPEVFDTTEFINADEIARGINPKNVDAAAFAAGKIMLQKIDNLIKEKKNFAFETTLSGLTYLKIIEQAKQEGFIITMVFVYLESYQIAQERVAYRVSKGGHNIPTDVIKRRYFKGLKNFTRYASIADDWYLLDNSKPQYNIIAKSISGQKEIINFDVFKMIDNNEFDR